MKFKLFVFLGIYENGKLQAERESVRKLPKVKVELPKWCEEMFDQAYEPEVLRSD